MTPPVKSIIRCFMPLPTDNACRVGNSCCRLPLLLGLVLLAMLAFRGFGPRVVEIENQSESHGHPGPDQPSDANDKVSLKIDFNDGRQLDFAAIPWQSGTTVADLFHVVQGVSIVQKGTGKAAFLVGINGSENEGADGNNWVYEVNGQSGDRSFADYVLGPGDRVLWTFRTSR